MLEAELPPGVTRDRYCSHVITLEDCDALQFEFTHEDGRDGSAIVWKHLRQRRLRPVQKGKRLTELRPGDEVVAFGKRAKVTAVIVYR